MPRTSRQGVKRAVGLALLALCAQGLAGCGFFDRSSDRDQKEAEIRVVPVAANSAVALQASDVIKIMRTSGFSDRQIFYFGAKVRDALMRYGGADIKVADRFEASYRVQGDLVWIGTNRGPFLYDVKNGEFRLGPQSSAPRAPR